MYGVLDAASGAFNYARAGHELPIFYDRHGELVTLPIGPGLPLGATDEILLDEQTVILPPGSTLLFYTDGLTDALNADGEQFGLEQLRKALLGTRHTMAQSICESLLQTVSAHCAGAPQYDDITLVALQVT